MTPLYRIAYRLLSWYSEQIDRALFWLYVRLVDDIEFEVWEMTAEPPPEPSNVVHLPRRGLH